MPGAVFGAPRRRLLAPRRSGETLLDPLPSRWDVLFQRNVTLRTRLPDRWAKLSADARKDLLKHALAYTREYRDVDASNLHPDRIVLAGHQPELFHPGVWFKNFLIGQFGGRYSAIPVQLIIDNDVYRAASIVVPTGSLAQPRVEHVPFDVVDRAVPIEASTIQDVRCFETFADRVVQTIRPLLASPLVEQYWPFVKDQYRRTANVGQAIAAARHILEGRAGLQSLELPLSAVCRGDAFARFVAHIIDRIADFSAVYNDCLSQFRAKHKLRSRSHPVPDLEIASPEFETPFWIWSHADPIRRRLYVRRFEGRLELHDRHQFRSVIGSAAALVDQLKQLGQRGIALRPRALMTTMFARVFLSDWFVHGIGGAVYDEVTDEMVRRFFEIEPPPFLTATATLQLPIESPDVMPTDLGQLKNQMRSLEFHPETHVAEGREGISELVSAKKAWIDQTGGGADLRARHQAIGEINRQLAALLTGQADELKRQYERLVADLRRASLLKSREYSFVLFPPALIDELQAMAARCGLAK